MDQSKNGSERHALERILDTPELAQIVPQLQPELLHRVIQRCGLEDCGDLVALATPQQVADLFDLDLWQAARPGRPGGPGGHDRFDPDRFGVWIEVLAEAGPAAAANKLAGIDTDLVVAGLAQHILVFDGAAVADYETTDGDVVAGKPPAGPLTARVGGYLVVARRTDAWDAIVSVLRALGEEDEGCFQEVMAGCRALSNSTREIDGLDDLLEQGDQAMFDVAVGRARRREQHGYVAAADARAFLEMSRKADAGSRAMPAANPIAQAYFRGLGGDRAGETSTALAQLPAAAALLDAFVEVGILEPAPRALLAGSQPETPRLARIRSEMEALLDRHPDAFTTRIDEMAFLANTLKAGCSLQARAFTGQEAWDAAVAVCNLGLETLGPGGHLLTGRDLITVFQTGWTRLHDDVTTYAAAGLVGVLKDLRCGDRETQAGLNVLRVEMRKHLRAGAPWRAREAMDVLAILDLPAWAALLGLIDECPVVVTQGATAFEFISEDRQIQTVHAFVRSLGEAFMA